MVPVFSVYSVGGKVSIGDFPQPENISKLES